MDHAASKSSQADSSREQIEAATHVFGSGLPDVLERAQTCAEVWGSNESTVLSPMTRGLVAVDLGASSGRVTSGMFDGRRLVLGESYRFPTKTLMGGSRLRWNLRELLQQVEEGLAHVARESSIDSVAVDSWGVDFGCLDRRGHLIENPCHYRDPRRAEAHTRALARVSPETLFARTGVQPLKINSIFELAAMVEAGDRELRDARRLLMIADLVHHHLGGSGVGERTNASTTQCLDPHRDEWADDLLELLDIPSEILPPLVSPGTEVGKVAHTDTRADGAAIVAVATHDTASAVAAIPGMDEASAFLSVGTWSLVGVETDVPIISDEALAAGFTNEAGVGASLFLRNLTGLWLLEECRRAWAREGRKYEVSELVSLAERAPAHVSLVDPNAPLFEARGDMPRRIVAYCRSTRQPAPADHGAMVRCILESLALKHAETVALLERITGRRIGRLHFVGGGARNTALCRWTANVTQLPVFASQSEATTIGNLLIQAVALGDVKDIAEAREVAQASFTATAYAPTDTDSWAEARARFARLTSVSNEEYPVE